MLRSVCATCLLVSLSLAAQDFEVANIHCKGGWITQGDDKFVVIERCGEPLMNDVISGEDSFKVEKLAYRLGRSKKAPLTIITIVAGKVSRIEQAGR